MTKLLVGPLLGLEGDSRYTFCFLTSKDVNSAGVVVDGENVAASAIADTPDGRFWRAEIDVAVPEGSVGREICYQVILGEAPGKDCHNRDSWNFYVPAVSEDPKIVYASCNGVSKSDLITKMDDPFRLWREMFDLHQAAPFSILLMGGDQIYADSIWDKVKDLEKWSVLRKKEQIKRPSNKLLSDQLDRFYSKIYVERWNEKYMSAMLASVPSLMMWDDHDIFDGWGSYPDDLQKSPVFLEIFKYAKKYFELFQMRSSGNATIISSNQEHYSFSVKFRNYAILALDNRANRLIEQVMEESQWKDIIAELNNINDGHLLIMSAVPVVYRDFSFTETAFDITPWEDGLADDLKDHWRAKEHQGERIKLIMNLLRNARKRFDKDNDNKTVILSGDVHVGCLGVITDKSQESTIKVHQVVSSGVVHPAPSLIGWLGIKAVTNDDMEVLNEERTIETIMLKPVGSGQYIRARNFATLQRGTDGKIWVNWIAEADEKPEYPIS